MESLYLELAEVRSYEGVTNPVMRLCLALEKRFPNIRGWQLEQIQELCLIAINNENSFFMFEDAWLKTTLSLSDPVSFFGRRFSRDELTKRITTGSGPPIAIRRNVLPGEEYWTRLQEVCHRSPWTREFYTHRVLEEALREGKSLAEKLKERRKQGEQCALAMSLRAARKLQEVNLDRPANPNSMELRVVDPMEVVRVKRLAKGGEGVVWKVVRGNCSYAMKTFVTKGPFVNERRVAELRPVLHPHIVHAFGFGVDEEQPCLLMELHDGDLERCLCEHTRAGFSDARVRFSRVEKLDVLLQVASAMRNLHENNVVHGDLKLANILLSDFEVSGHVRHFLAKVADFGSAKIIDPKSPFIPSMGTAVYASPEVLQRRVSRQQRFPKPVSTPRKLDVYSFGVVAYEILTGHWAFGRKLDQEEMRSVGRGEMKLIDSSEWRKLQDFGHFLHFKYSRDVINLVESCLEIDPNKRPTFSEICRELRNSKLNLQAWEKSVAACQKFFGIIVILLTFFLHYVFRVVILTLKTS